MIKLSFIELRDKKLEELVPGYGYLTRLICNTKFKKPDGWTKSYDAIIDTGAHTSIIPLEIWQDMETKILADHHVRGISPKKECYVDIKIARVKAVLFDENGNATPELEIFTYLALDENIPLILGFKTLLDKFKLCFDYKANEAWLDEK